MSEPGRKMIFPYTITQRVKHFPWLFHYKHNERFKMVPLTIFLSVILSYKAEKALHSPGNIALYEKYRRIEREEWAKHAEHLEGYRHEGH